MNVTSKSSKIAPFRVVGRLSVHAAWSSSVEVGGRPSLSCRKSYTTSPLLNRYSGHSGRPFSSTCSYVCVSNGRRSIIGARVWAKTWVSLKVCAMRAAYCCLIRFPHSLGMNGEDDYSLFNASTAAICSVPAFCASSSVISNGKTWVGLVLFVDLGSCCFVTCTLSSRLPSSLAAFFRCPWHQTSLVRSAVFGSEVCLGLLPQFCRDRIYVVVLHQICAVVIANIYDQAPG